VIRIARRASWIVCAVVAALAMVSLTSTYSRAFERIWALPRGDWPSMWVSLSRLVFVLAFIRSLAVAALVQWGVRRGGTKRWAVVAILFTVGDLWWLSRDVAPRMPGEFYTPPPVTRELTGPPDRYRVFNLEAWRDRRADLAGTDQAADVEGARTWFADNPLPVQAWILRAALFPRSATNWGYRSVMEGDYDRTNLLPTVDFDASMIEVRQRRPRDWDRIFMAMSNAWYRSGPLVPMKSELARTGGRLDRIVPLHFEKKGEWPRYYFADEIVSIRDRNDFVERLVREDHSEKVAFIEGRSFHPAGGSVLSVDERASSISLDVEADGRSLLVLSVTPHEYWTATVDGRTVEPVVVNVGFQGIELEGGRHRIEMRYRNPIVLRAGAVTLASLALVGALAIPRRRAARRGGRREEYNPAS